MKFMEAVAMLNENTVARRRGEEGFIYKYKDQLLHPSPYSSQDRPDPDLANYYRFVFTISDCSTDDWYIAPKPAHLHVNPE